MNHIAKKKVFSNPLTIAALSCFGLALIVFFAIEWSPKAHSATYNRPDGSTFQVDITANVSDGPDVTNLCPAGRNKPNFTAYIDTPSIRIDLAPNAQGQSLLYYDLYVKWRTCDRDTRGYAVYGKKFCPDSGFYGGSGTADPDQADENYLTYDCVKYIDPSTNDYQNNPSLGCPFLGTSTKNPPYPCTINTARDRGVFIKALQPVKSGATVLPLTQLFKSIGGRPNAQTTASGSDSYGGKICQYYWFANESAKESDNSICVNLRIDYKWTYTPPPSYELQANVQTLGDTFSYYKDIINYNWGASVTSAANLQGDGVGNHNVDLWRIVYKGAPAAWGQGTITGDGGPCGSLPGYFSCEKVTSHTCVTPGECNTMSYGGYWNWQENANLGPYDVGTRVCYIARVSKPTYTSSASDWRGSAQECSLSAKKPRVQFLGDDVRVAGKAASSPYTIQGRYYGSWAEYGMFLTGTNDLVASGNGLRGGNLDGVQRNWSRLTFANTPSYGGYTRLPVASSAYSYFSNLPRQNGNSLNAATIPNGVYDMTGKSVGNTLTKLPQARGGGVVLVANGDFKVTKMMADSTYPMNNNLSSIRDITQLVIVADNITIDPDVTRLDAWLITPTGGSINTCIGPNNLTANVCNTPLTVNGAISTSRLYLRRTAGANLPGPAEMSAPAEQFNLRPDAQLWAYSYANKADYAQTDFVQELPPRY